MTLLPMFTCSFIHTYIQTLHYIRKKKILGNLSLKEECSLCALTDILFPHMVAAPGKEATIYILAENMMLTLLFQIKLECCIYQTLG